MITYFKTHNTRLDPLDDYEPGCWVQVVNPLKFEVDELVRRFGLEAESITDILDADEQSRIEKEDTYTLVLLRLPYHDAEQEVPHYTVPVGLFLLDDGTFITVSLHEVPVLAELGRGRVRYPVFARKTTFLLSLLLRSAAYYLRYLKEINKRTVLIEKDLQRSIKNNELYDLLLIEKSLTFFTTSLKSNELVLRKLQNTKNLMPFNEDDEDMLNDVLIETRQAIEMANIYSSILSGMMDAFASIISNNLNIVMKRMTVISLVLSIPTLIASIYGMNVDLPFQTAPWAFAGVVLLSGILAIGGWIAFQRIGRSRVPRS